MQNRGLEQLSQGCFLWRPFCLRPPLITSDSGVLMINLGSDEDWRSSRLGAKAHLIRGGTDPVPDSLHPTALLPMEWLSQEVTSSLSLEDLCLG